MLPPNIPALELLKARRKWVAWKYVVRDGRKTKPPVNPHNGKLARNNKPEDWGSYEEAVERCKMDGLAGVGYVITQDDGITGADLDHVRDPSTAVLEPWAQEIVDLAETYIEVSPSGTGLRIFWIGKIDRVIKNDKMSVEVYGKGRYLTITGNHVAGTPEEILSAPKTLAALQARAGKKKDGESASATGNLIDDTSAPEHILAAKVFGRGTIEAEENMNKWQRLNNEALANLDKWVPALFPQFNRTDDGRYRITSKMLGRNLQEDLSISPEGIIDFGIADQGDDREGKRTALDLVQEYSVACRGIEEELEKFNVAYRTLARALGHTEEQIEPKSDSVEIQLADGQIARIVDELQRGLVKLKRPVFVRGGFVVEPLWEEFPTQNGGKTQVTTFHTMKPTNLMYMCSKHSIKFMKINPKTRRPVETDAPAKVLNVLLELGHWTFPRVSGIINSPTMRPDGTILNSKGYDKVTQLWCWPDDSLRMPEIKEQPTKKDAAKALKLLKDLLAEFPMKAELDLSVALAAILATTLRGAFGIAPMYLFLAHTAGTGKSYIVDLISTIVRGRPCPVITASRNEEEMEKRIGALLIESMPIVSLDNLSFDLKSDVLCQMCTQHNIKVRILGKSENADCEWKGTLFATGNNVNLSGDMARRGLICNMDAGMEHPEQRKFDKNPIDMVLNDRGSYLAAALLIARAYLVSGEKVECTEIGSYGEWSRFVREPLIWLGMPDPVKSMEQAYKNDPAKEAAETLIEQWKAVLGTERSYKGSEIIAKARESKMAEVMSVGSPDYVYVYPDFYEVLNDRCGERGNIEPRKLGFWLRSLRGQVYSGHKIVAAMETDKHGQKWRLIPI